MQIETSSGAARRGTFSEADLETAYAMALIGFVDVNIWLIVGFLFVVGSSLAPAQTPSPQERIWSAVTLTSLSACSVTGAGFCRFDYQRRQQLLSVETVPSNPGQPSVGRVERCW